jgi:signal peptidase II
MNYVRNQGAAWGTLSAVADKYRIPFFYAVTVLACIVIIVFFLNTPADQLRSRYALILIFAGAIGNFLDRLRLGYVIDWIDVHWNVAGWRYFFPNFNIADVGITVGVLFLLVDIVLAEIKGTRPSVST